MRVTGFPAVEGVTLRAGERLTTAVRKPNGNISLILSVQPYPGRGIPFLRSAARAWGIPFRMARQFRLPGDAQIACKSRPWEIRAARAVGRKPYVLSCAATLFRIVGIALLYLALPDFLTSLTGGGFLWAMLRLLLAGAALYRVARVRFLRRLSMYTGAAHKMENAVESGRGTEYEDILQSSRLRPASDGAFAAASFLLAVFASALLPAGMPYPALLLARLALAAGIPAVGGELLRFGRVQAICRMPLLLAEKLIVLEPHVEMLETAQVAYRALKENP